MSKTGCFSMFSREMTSLFCLYGVFLGVSAVLTRTTWRKSDPFGSLVYLEGVKVSSAAVAGPRSRSPRLQQRFEQLGIEHEPDDLRKGVGHLLFYELGCELGEGNALLPDESIVRPFVGAHIELATRPEGDEPCNRQDVKCSRVQML